PASSAFSADFQACGLVPPKANRARSRRPPGREVSIARTRSFAERGIGVSQGYVESDVRERMAQFVANRCHPPLYVLNRGAVRGSLSCFAEVGISPRPGLS